MTTEALSHRVLRTGGPIPPDTLIVVDVSADHSKALRINDNVNRLDTFFRRSSGVREPFDNVVPLRRTAPSETPLQEDQKAFIRGVIIDYEVIRPADGHFFSAIGALYNQPETKIRKGIEDSLKDQERRQTEERQIGPIKIHVNNDGDIGCITSDDPKNALTSPELVELGEFLLFQPGIIGTAASGYAEALGFIRDADSPISAAAAAEALDLSSELLIRAFSDGPPEELHSILFSAIVSADSKPLFEDELLGEA